MRKLISFVHISLDGFIAGPKGEMDWMQHNSELFKNIDQRIQKTDTALYGRNTYQMMEEYWPNAGKNPQASTHEINHSHWYAKADKIIVSNTLKEVGLTNTTIIRNNLSEKIKEIKQQEGSEILVFGSPSVTHALIKEKLIDGYWLFVNPVILGKGIPLFIDIQERIKLKLISNQIFSSGVIELN
jgi:dihydrofolate reductase